MPWKTFNDIMLRMLPKKVTEKQLADKFLKMLQVQQARKKAGQTLAEGDMHGWFSVTGDPDVEMAWYDRELEYIANGRPYYNVSNEIAQDILRADLSIIQSNQIAIPANFGSINIRFQQDSAIHYQTANKEPATLYSAFVTTFISANSETPDIPDTLAIAAQVSPNSNFPQLIGFYLRLSEASLEEEINNLKSRWGQIQHFDGIMSVVKVIATLKFLTDCPDEHLITYDVVNKYAAEFHNPATSADRKEEIIAISKKRGHHGWNVGTNELYLLDYNQTARRVSTNPTGRELEYAHLRRGHLHAVRFGEGKEHIKIKFFRPSVIRGDLPFKPVE